MIFSENRHRFFSERPDPSAQTRQKRDKICESCRTRQALRLSRAATVSRWTSDQDLSEIANAPHRYP